ncbi:hypothetical protein PF002_g33330 [Phytophthora fragariae]|nr:hypothetical protein PF002_g33330 [Phytophthora fragariae]
MLEDIHETYFNATLTANLPPQVNLRHNANIPHVTIFKELYNSNTDGSKVSDQSSADSSKDDFRIL